MPNGTYIGPEEQFKGRRANLGVYGDIVRAQFDEGKLWETHSRINFPIQDWDIEEDNWERSYCNCSSTFVCFHCLHLGQMQQHDKPETD